MTVYQLLCILYVGDPLKWTRLNTDSVDRKILEQVNWGGKKLNAQKPVDFQQLQNLQQKNTGLPGEQWLSLCADKTG